MPSPADRGKPGPRSDHRRCRGRERDRLPPALEPRRRRAGIQTALSHGVLPAIHQYVNERVPHCPRAGERSSVIAISPDGAAAAKRAVDCARHADREAPQAAAERARVVGFDDQMEMIVLHREMDNPEAAVRGRGQGAADGREDPGGSQAADGRTAAESYMHRVRRNVHRPGPMRDAGAAAAPGTWRRKPELQGARHLDQAINTTLAIMCQDPTDRSSAVNGTTNVLFEAMARVLAGMREARSDWLPARTDRVRPSACSSSALRASGKEGASRG